MLALAVAMLQAGVPAADSTGLRHANGTVPPAIRAVRVAHAPLLDGRLDDDAWRGATPITDLRQSDPEEGQPVSQTTEIRVVYDDAALYIGARLHDREAARIVARLGRRDAFTASDDFRVLIDSYHDHNTAFRFDVNAAGVRSDLAFGDDGDFADDSWDPVWDAATTRDSLGWTVEERIPFSQLRFSRAAVQVWGIRFVRTIQRRNEFAMWPFIGKTESGFVSKFGHLLGIEGIPAPRRLEVLPYTVARGTSPGTSVNGSPFEGRSAYTGGAGVDVKYGVTSNLTLDATVNPDFGQVESDPAFVNLTAFEQFLQERRPFFVEGASIFSFGGTGGFIGFGGTPRVFYSRRIGRPPTGAYTTSSVPGAFLNLPTNTTLLGAAKLTGRTPSGWSVGVIEAVTPVERARFEDTLGVQSLQDAEPLSNYFIGRAKRDFHNGQTGFGVLTTAVHRDLRGAVFNRLRSAAYLAGVDFFHRWKSSAYSLLASVSLAHVRGDTLAIQGAQAAPSRYYTRPDADYLTFDATRTSLTGVSADVSLNKPGGSTNWAVGASTTTPGYEVNDLGFQTRVDRISAAAFLGHRWTKPGKVFRQSSLSASGGPSWNYGGDNIQASFSGGGFAQFLNFWGANLNAGVSLRAIDDRLTRGGPLAQKPQSYFLGAGFFTDSRKPIEGSVFLNYNGDEAGGSSVGVFPFVSYRPSGAVELSLSPGYSSGRSRSQFVRRKVDSTATATYAARYVFADLRQRSVDVTLRLNVTMSPTLSFQLYAQPFTFAGDYSGFKELRASRTFDFNVYGRDNGSTITVTATDPEGRPATYQVDPTGAAGDSVFTFSNPDFRTRSLRSNAVLRWEYRPGSTLYLVWTQSRGSFVPFDPAFAMGRDFRRELFLDRPQNVLLVKLNYWLSL
jgi:Domain of unknown function (DUF5916)/Carbohydrate family 9 binding domain-like